MIYSAHCAPHKFTVYKSCKFVIITEKGGNNTKNINVNVQRPPTNIPLGRQGENLATCIIFDCTGLVQLYGDGTAELLHELKDGTIYPVAVTQDGASVSWTVSASDTANIGSGRAELRWYVGDTLAKSAKFRTSVSSALADGTTETPPEPQQSWVDKVLAAAQEIKDGAISDEKLAAAIAAYLQEHPIDAGLDEAALAAYLVENGYLKNTDLADAVAQALADAKASGEFDGAPGKDGTDGAPGADGADGVGIQSVVQTTTSAEDGGTNVITVTKTDGTTSTFRVKNGSKGSDGVPGKDGANGADGQPGTDGVTPNIQIGTVETLEAGSPATASITGTPENPLLNLGIPKGADGTSGSVEMPNGGEETWVVVADETLTEDVASVVYSELSLKKVRIDIFAIGSATTTVSGNGNLAINNKTIFYSNGINPAGDGTKRWVQFFAECINSTAYHIGSTNNNNSFQSTNIVTGWLDDIQKIETIKIYTNGGNYVIGKGTRIRILGVATS